MPEPRKHHYLPVFYLKRWAGLDGRVCVYRRPYQDVEVKWLHPGGVGFEVDLYSIGSRTDPAARQEVETALMTPIDTQAAKALEYIETYGTRPPDPRLQAGWSKFVLSLVYRNPRQINFIRRRVREHDVETWGELERNYDAVRGQDDPPTFREYRETRGVAECEETEAQLVRSMIESDWIGTHLTDMHWAFVRLEAPKFGLLTSDDAVMTSNGLGHRDSFVVLPVGPRAAFLAVNDLKVRDAFVAVPNKLERAWNDAVVYQAEKIVIGVDSTQKPFVDRRLGHAAKTAENGWSAEASRFSWASPVIFPDSPPRRRGPRRTD